MPGLYYERYDQTPEGGVLLDCAWTPIGALGSAVFAPQTPFLRTATRRDVLPREDTNEQRAMMPVD